jgi:hypothetical protein
MFEKIKTKYETFDKIKDKSNKIKGRYSEMLSRPNINVNIINRTNYTQMNLESDYTEHLLTVSQNLREINQNLKDTSLSLKAQGEGLRKMQSSVYDTHNSTNRANKTLTTMTYGRRCQLLLLNLIAILLFIIIAILLILKFLK